MLMDLITTSLFIITNNALSHLPIYVYNKLRIIKSNFLFYIYSSDVKGKYEQFSLGYIGTVGIYTLRIIIFFVFFNMIG